MIKPLDLVETPGGGLALVTEMSPANDNIKRNQYSITFLKGKNPNREHNAWWYEEQLTLVDSILTIIAEAMCHPFGNNKVHIRKTVFPT